MAIVVTYHPNLVALKTLLDATLAQINCAVVIDNGSDIAVAQWLNENYPAVTCISLPENFGIAAAQNKGLDWAIKHGANYALLFDQDSVPAPAMTQHLVRVFREESSKGIRIAAVGPKYDDVRHPNASPFVAVEGVRIVRRNCDDDNGVVPVDFVIASGSLIPLAALRHVGMMNENLFIDYVDVEWGLRARKKGYFSFGVCAAHMMHTLGDDPVYFLGRRFTLHSPLRHYYLFRNAIWLYVYSSLPARWKIADGLRLIVKFVLYCMLGRPRFAHFKMMSLGLFHGLIGRLGRIK